MLEAALEELIERVVKRVISKELQSWRDDFAPGKSELLDVKQTADILNVSPKWLYKNSHRLPFTVKMGDKLLRFRKSEIEKYLKALPVAPREFEDSEDPS